MSNLHRPLKHILRREKAHILLRDSYEDFTAAVRHGLNQLVSIPASIRAPLRPRTLACLLNDHIVEDAIRRFEPPIWKINQDFEGTFFVRDGKAALRFKKVDGDLSPSNIPTERQFEINHQMEIVGFERATYVTIGYQVNPTWTGVAGVSLVCFRGTTLLWSIPISDPIEAFMFDHEGNATDVIRPVVRATGRERERNA